MIRVLVFLTIVLFLSVVPAPVVPPSSEINFDPNDAPSPVMASYIINAGETLTGQIDVVEPESEAITISANPDILSIVNITDSNTPDGKLYTCDWSYSPTAADNGFQYINIRVTDQAGNQDNRTIVFKVIYNKPPVITGCRSGGST